jgi:IclR family transcriptional regulator, acetate operon repressor
MTIELRLGGRQLLAGEKQTNLIDTGTLGKAMSVLDVVAHAIRPLRFTDLLELIDQPRGTLHRQISNLIAATFAMNSGHGF